MNKRQYEKPATRVIALQQRHHLLGMSGEISGYQKSSSGFKASKKTTKTLIHYENERTISDALDARRHDAGRADSLFGFR